MAVGRGGRVDGALEIELANDMIWSQIEVLLDDLNQFAVGPGASAEGVDEDGKRVGNTNGVGNLDESPLGEASSDDALGDPASSVASRAIDLGGGPCQRKHHHRGHPQPP
eukprot:TRINITY_DN960_c0_g1_i2.p2 TRINITY_DN960_c0_g1~~TRINITY_DN960_c0_g1_i2.p2  ORF type:complete len:110 (-),score=33.46 TRINITY_DN960_c0_g1_i2:166-495(-)